MPAFTGRATTTAKGTKMNPVIRDQWVSDLNSGEYVQGKSVLTRVTADGTELNCCLGVLCEQAVKAGIVERRNVDGEGAVHYGSDDGAATASYLPESVLVWAGIDDYNPYLTTADGNHAEASHLNDREDNLTFLQIAELIAAQY